MKSKGLQLNRRTQLHKMTFINITGTDLKKDGDEDNGNSGSNKELPAADAVGKREGQGE